jgi:hypothetical protein
MMGLPNWLRGREDDVDMTHDEVPIPPIAKVEPAMKRPLPFHIAPVEKPTGVITVEGHIGEHEANIVRQAHSYIEQWKLKDTAQQQKIEQLESDLKAKHRECDLLELDIAQQLNTIATLQSEVLAAKAREDKFRAFFSVKKQICEKERLTYIEFEIEDPPKKERKPPTPKVKHPKKALADGTLPGDETK